MTLAYYNKQHAVPHALEEREKAFSLDTTDYRILMELDQLYKKLGRSFTERLAFLEQYPQALEYRDDLYLEVVTLYNAVGNHELALDLVMKRRFHPWEGGEGKATGEYVAAHTEIAKKALIECDYANALVHLNAMDEYPHNLGEGKLYGVRENDTEYWKGIAYQGLNDDSNAVQCWQRASIGITEPSAAMFYNDQQPDKIFYQGLALVKLGKFDEAHSRFNTLKDYGERHISDNVTADYFAVSLPDFLIWDDDMQKRNTLHCMYLIGLGNLGLGHTEKAREFFTKIIEQDIYHRGSRVHLNMC